jgi:cellobiose phosphorylase
VKRVFRGCTYNISIQKSKGISKGVKQILLNGKAIEGNIVPFENSTNEVTVDVKMN